MVPPENQMKCTDYRTQVFSFQGRLTAIVYQNDNTSCPLLALCNSLLLLGDFRPPLVPFANVSEETLIKMLCDYYMTKATIKGSKTRAKTMKSLKRLTLPIGCNMIFTSVEHMETNNELKLFEQFGVEVYHANLVDPQDKELVRAIGENSYDTLSAGLIAHRAKTDVCSHSPSSSRLDESEASHLEVLNWDLIDGFLNKNTTQATAYGLQTLTEHIVHKKTTVCVLFWNHHFHVVWQWHGKLLMLQNNPEQPETNVIWRSFDDVNGDGLFLDSRLLPLQVALSEVSDDSWLQKKGGNVYVAKSVNFKGRQPFIIYPYKTGSCALVALCNAILLRGDVELGKLFDVNLTLNLLHISRIVSHASRQPSCTPIEKEKLMLALGRLHQPVHFNMNFRNIFNIKISETIDIFKNFGFRLCHGFIANPEDLNLCNAIGPEYYDVTAESPTSHLESGDHRKLVDDFIEEHDIELTPYGLRSLKEELCDRDIYVIFWNKQFHTAIKCNNQVFVLDPNLTSFDQGQIWRTLDSVDGAGETLASVPYPVDGAGATLASIPHPISGESGEHKCIRCVMEFTSLFNLQRHNYVHPTSSARKKLDIFESRDELSSYWDNLSSEEASEILSLKDMKFKNMQGFLIVRILEQRSKGDKVAMALLSFMSRSLEGEKIMSGVLFSVLDEASENTLLCSDIRNCEDERIWAGGVKDIMSNMHSLLACYSYLIEKALMEKWFQHKTEHALEVGDALIAEEERAVQEKVNVQNIHGGLHISAQSSETGTSNSTSQHDSPHLAGTGEFPRENRVDGRLFEDSEIENVVNPHLAGPVEFPRENRIDGHLLDNPEIDSIGNLYDLVLEFLQRFRNQAPKKFYRGTVEALRYMDNLDMHIHFPHIEEFSAELAAYIIDHYDTVSVKNDISRAAAQYLVEHNLGKSEKEILEGINVIIVDLPSPTSNMSFKKYARTNKLIRPFKLPKKFRRLFKLRWKGRVYMMTYAGRRAARGFLNFILEMHKRKLCWRGKWKFSDMRMKDGLFLIVTEALHTAEADGMAEDFKTYFEFMNPYYVIVEESSSISPPYWEILQTDTMAIPDPLKAPLEFDSFLKYMSAHFAYMPGVCIYQFLCLLFSICDGLRPRGDKQYQPLSDEPTDVSVNGWTLKAIGVFLFNDVFYFSKNNVVVNKYSDTYWHLLQYTRHFSNHILSLTKNVGGQDVQDMILIHLMLACRLDEHLTSLVRRIVNITNMQGLFYRAWQTLLASDDQTNEEDLFESLEVSYSEDEDEESDSVVEDASHQLEDGVIQDLSVFKSEDEE